MLTIYSREMGPYSLLLNLLSRARVICLCTFFVIICHRLLVSVIDLSAVDRTIKQKKKKRQKIRKR